MRRTASVYVADAVRREQALIAERTAYLVNFFRICPCVDCGETDLLVLEFDRLGHKNFNSTSQEVCATVAGSLFSTRSPPATWFVQTVIVGEPLFGLDSRVRG
jgi:hypothetical protein